MNMQTDIYVDDILIYMSQVVQAFQLGSSTVVTLPKSLGIKPGEKFRVEKSDQRITLKKEKMTDEEISKLVKSLSGGLNLKKDLTPEEINQELDRRYEDMLP